MPPPTRIKPRTRKYLRQRRKWRQRALAAALRLTTWPVGAPDREQIEKELARSVAKVRQWFDEPRAAVVIRTVQRRAIAEYRARA